MDFSSLFPLLLARFGIGPAFQILGLLDPNASAFSKILGGTQAAGSLASGAGALTGSPDLSSLGKDIGGVAGLAGLGAGIYNIANNPNLSTGQKAGAGGELAGETALSATVPYAGLGVLAKNLSGLLRNSGSPQLHGAGEALASPALPVEGLLNVLTGAKSPAAAFNSMTDEYRNMPLIGGKGGIADSVLNFFGFTQPTTGTMMRKEIDSLAGQLPELKGFKAGQDVLNAQQYNAFSPTAQQSAYALANWLGQYSPDYKKDPKDYQIQVGNSLLKQYGENVPNVLEQIATAGQQQAQAQAQAQATAEAPYQGTKTQYAGFAGGLSPDQSFLPAVMRTQFQAGLPNTTTPNKLQGVLGTLLAR